MERNVAPFPPYGPAAAAAASAAAAGSPRSPAVAGGGGHGAYRSPAVSPEAQATHLQLAAISLLHLPPYIAGLCTRDELAELLARPELRQRTPRPHPWDAAAADELIPWIADHDPAGAPPPQELAAASPSTLRRHAVRALQRVLGELRSGQPVNIAAGASAGRRGPEYGAGMIPPQTQADYTQTSPSRQNPLPWPSPWTSHALFADRTRSAPVTPVTYRLRDPRTPPADLYLNPAGSTNTRLSPYSPYSHQPAPVPFTPPAGVVHVSPYPVRQFLSPNHDTWIEGYVMTASPSGVPAQQTGLNVSLPMLSLLPPAVADMSPVDQNGQSQSRPVGVAPASGSAAPRPPGNVAERSRNRDVSGNSREKQQLRNVRPGEIEPLREFPRERAASSSPARRRNPVGPASPPPLPRAKIEVPSDRIRPERGGAAGSDERKVFLNVGEVKNLLRRYERKPSSRFTKEEVLAMNAYRRYENHVARKNHVARQRARQQHGKE